MPLLVMDEIGTIVEYPMADRWHIDEHNNLEIYETDASVQRATHCAGTWRRVHRAREEVAAPE